MRAAELTVRGAVVWLGFLLEARLPMDTPWLIAHSARLRAP